MQSNTCIHASKVLVCWVFVGGEKITTNTNTLHPFMGIVVYIQYQQCYMDLSTSFLLFFAESNVCSTHNFPTIMLF
jgi:hypothetical protein